MDMTIDAHVGVPVFTPDFKVNIANPVRETLRIDLQNDESGKYAISIYATDGHLVMTHHEDLDAGVHHLSYPFPFQKGVYFAVFTDESGQKSTLKLIHY